METSKKPRRISEAVRSNLAFQFSQPSRLSGNGSYPGSPSDGVGGLRPPLGEPLKKPRKYHDLIKFFPNTKERIFEVCAPLYSNGLSLREIERQTGFSKTSIRKTLNAGGLALRNYHGRQEPKSKDPRVMKPGNAPYGYAFLEGQLVKDPKEYKIVLQIKKLWQSGKSYSDIVRVLDNQKTTTRTGKRWNTCIIIKIIKRHEERKSWDLDNSFS